VTDNHCGGLLRLPRHVAFGSGSIAGLASIVAGLGERVVICTDPVIAATPALLAGVEALSAAGIEVTLVSCGEPELPVAAVEQAVAEATLAQPDVVVGWGGGSSLDLAKVVALLLTYPAPLSQYYGENAVPGPVLPLVAVPTTAGTGSEVTPVAVVADPERQLKVGVSSPHLVPTAAVVDPDLTVGCPPVVSAHSGIDALTHAVESLTARQARPAWGSELPVFIGRGVLTASLSLQAATAIGPALARAVSDGTDLDARTALAHGSLLAGMAFGTAGTHLSHALQYPLGAATHTSHGLGVGLLLPYVVAACAPATAPQLAQLAEAWDLPGEGAAADAVVARIIEIRAAIGIPHSLAEIGVDAAMIPTLVDQALTVKRLVGNAPVEADQTVLTSILTQALHGL
jgi:alcohol dehydrogenase